MKLVHVLLVALLAVGLQAKDAQPNPVQVKADQMVADAEKSIKQISPKQLFDMIKAEEDFLLIDVREPNEVESAFIDHIDYKHFPLGPLPFKVAAIDTNKKIVVYCKVGGRGALGTSTLQNLGFKNVTNLKGGIKAWIAAGYPVENSLGTFKAAK